MNAAPVPKAGGFPPLGAHGVSEVIRFSFIYWPVTVDVNLTFLFSYVFSTWKPFQAAPAPLPTSLAGWMANPSSVPHPAASAGPMSLGAPNNLGMEQLLPKKDFFHFRSCLSNYSLRQ